MLSVSGALGLRFIWSTSPTSTAIRMASAISGSHHEIVQAKQIQLLTLFEHGALKPFFLWYLLVLFGLPLSALLTLHYNGSKYLRFAVFALILSTASDIIKYRRALLGANGYIVGVVVSYWVIWSATLLIFNDVEKTFKRIERRAAPGNASTLGGPEFIDTDKDEDVNIADPDGGDALPSNDNSAAEDPASISDQQSGKNSMNPYQGEFFIWQTYPQSFLHRLNWTFDLLSNMRGAQWNWRISHMGPLPASVHAQLHPGKRDTSREVEDSMIMDYKARLKAGFASFLRSYLLLDLIKVLMIRDPYFKGVVSPTPPPPFPFDCLADFPMIITLYRHVVTGLGVCAALDYALSFNPIIFLGLSTAFPNAARALTSVPLDASWLYSNAFGPFLSTVLENGLAGCWGIWWHQLFRPGFTNTARWLLSLLPERLATRHDVRRVTIPFVAFLLSGLLHACGSYAQLADTNPRDTFLFFILQAVGVTIEDTFKRVILPTLLPLKLPRWLRRAGNFLFAFCWLYFPGHYIADDFARGGIWITEPIPLSPLRGLELGVKGEGWWCWKEPWFRSFKGDGWWQSGLAVL